MSAFILEKIRKACFDLCPEFSNVLKVESEVTASTWKASLSSGKALELLSLCGLLSSCRELGMSIELPSLYIEQPELFYLRNVIPRQYVSKPGHSHDSENGLSLKWKFAAALTPKAIIRNEHGLQYCVFREGIATHMIRDLVLKKSEYLDRPDIIVTAGEYETNFLNDSIIEFKYKNKSDELRGSLRIKNSESLPLIDFQGNCSIEAKLIIECSVDKKSQFATGQLVKYKKLFAGKTNLHSTFVNGGSKKSLAFDENVNINLKANVDIIKNAMLIGMNAAAKSLQKS